MNIVTVNRVFLKILKNNWSQRIFRIVIGGIFIFAGYVKLIAPDRFAQQIMAYEILPWGFVNIFTVWLLCLEILVGIFVVAGIWVRSCSVLLTGLCVLFIGAVAYALARDISLHCGCFSTASSGPARTWTSLWQEVLILLGCVNLWAAKYKRNVSHAN